MLWAIRRRYPSAIDVSQAIRGFVSIDLTHDSAPVDDAAEVPASARGRHDLRRIAVDEINGDLVSEGRMTREGTIVEATLTAASPSTKNHDEKRNPEVHQSKKGCIGRLSLPR